MDAETFDRLVLALTDGRSRRSLLALLAGFPLAGTIATLQPDEALARRRQRRRVKRDRRAAHTRMVAERRKKKKKKRGGGVTAPPPLLVSPPPNCGNCDQPCMTGNCVGGVCKPNPAGTVCAPPSCANGILTPASTCDGNGTCRPGQPEPCPNGNCSGSSCGPCASRFQCGTTRWCNAGTCQPRKANGTACAVSQQCQSNYCVNNVCCDTDCGARPNATQSCASGTCVYTCVNGFDDCDGNMANGCESNLFDSNNCGVCGNDCSLYQCSEWWITAYCYSDGTTTNTYCVCLE